MRSLDVAGIPATRSLLRSRWPQFLVQLVLLSGFTLAAVSGLVGTPVGNRNFAIIAVWVGWWAILMLVAVPLLGRAWCSVCPLPLPGEWLQRGSVFAPRGRPWGLGLRWPNRFRNLWLQNGVFVLMALVSLVILTTPTASAALLMGLVFTAIAVSMVFERRAFCRYLCPIGGFIGLYSQASPLELRVKDRSICAAHAEKTCYSGDASGYGCPWQVFPPGLTKNLNCGLCLECIRTCPHENIAVNLRAPGAELLLPSVRGLDEAMKGLLMLGSAGVYSALMLGPWAVWRDAAYAVGQAPWFAYAGGFLAATMLVFPSLYLLSILAGRALARSAVPVRKLFTSLSGALIPLGLAAWIAFSLGFLLPNLSYLWPVLSDPLGSGWDLLGTAGAVWTPYGTGVVPTLQSIVLAVGLAWSCATAQRIAAGMVEDTRRRRALVLPVAGFLTLSAAGLMWLLAA